MPEILDSPSGEPGELVERFKLALRRLGEVEPEPLSLIILGLLVMTDAPGDLQAQSDLALATLVARLKALCRLGVGESLLIDGATNYVTRLLKDLSGNIGVANANRASFRDYLLYLSEHPDEFRRNAAKYPSRKEQADWSDEQVLENLRKQAAAPQLNPVDADGAAASWAAVESWAKISGEIISDSLLNEWDKKNRRNRIIDGRRA